MSVKAGAALPLHTIAQGAPTPATSLCFSCGASGVLAD